jgi:methyl-accepting chemotaxis protein
MRRLSIRSSLIGLFSLMMVIIAAQGFLALNKVSAVNDSVVDIGGNWLPSVDLVRAMNTTLARYRLAEAKHVMSPDAAAKAGFENEISARFNELVELRKKYEPLISSEEERTAYNTYVSHRERYLKLHNSLIEMSRKNDVQGATKLFMGESFEAYDTLTKDVARLVELNDAGAKMAVEAAAVNYSSTRMTTILMLVVGVAIALGAASFSFFGIARPINRITEGMGVLAGGNTDAEIPFSGRADEIGSMAAAVRVFRDNMIENRRMEAEQKEAEQRAAAEKKAAEEREQAMQKAAEEKAAAERKAAMHRLAEEFEKAVGNIIENVSSASTELEAAASTLTRTAETTQQLSTAVASASEQASSNVQSVASATEEMTGSVAEISRQVQESSTIAKEAVQQAQKTDVRINDLSQAAGRIGDVVKLITAIAEQTNLLALNATIEAARAGEAGKGFAVVAQEVKALAGQTAKATGEIGSQISGMQAATNESVAAIKEIGSTIGRISEIAATIAVAVEEQGAATNEIARNVQEAAKGTAEVAGNIVHVNHGAGETGSASSQVLASAQALAGESNHLKSEVRKFLSTVRAA